MAVAMEGWGCRSRIAWACPQNSHSARQKAIILEDNRQAGGPLNGEPGTLCVVFHRGVWTGRYRPFQTKGRAEWPFSLHPEELL